ncbi:hypothetical protein BDC45DRAFT_611477 [Circinella umbellata]|nr:hypothetical protein BDC45DRAFT_611477 [Circinella umbellata]
MATLLGNQPQYHLIHTITTHHSHSASHSSLLPAHLQDLVSQFVERMIVQADKRANVTPHISYKSIESRHLNALRLLYGEQASFTSNEQALAIPPNFLTIVVVPLVALTEDLIRRLQQQHISVSKWEARSPTNPQASILLVPVEAVATGPFVEYVEQQRARLRQHANIFQSRPMFVVIIDFKHILMGPRVPLALCSEPVQASTLPQASISVVVGYTNAQQVHQQVRDINIYIPEALEKFNTVGKCPICMIYGNQQCNSVNIKFCPTVRQRCLRCFSIDHGQRNCPVKYKPGSACFFCVLPSAHSLGHQRKNCKPEYCTIPFVCWAIWRNCGKRMFKNLLGDIGMPPMITTDQEYADFLLAIDENRLNNSLHLFLEFHSVF